MMTAVPLPAAVILPPEVTEATSELLLVQSSVLFVALEGVPVTVSVSVSPTFSERSDLLSVRLVTSTAVRTCTLTVAFTVEFEVCAVMTQSP